MECDLHGYFESYFVQLLTEQGYFPIINGVVKIFDSFGVFFSIFHHKIKYSQKAVVTLISNLQGRIFLAC